MFLLDLRVYIVHNVPAGINPYVIAFTALASGTSWPDLVASKIAAERQLTADSAIANITCRFLYQSTMPLTYYILLYIDRSHARSIEIGKLLSSFSNFHCPLLQVSRNSNLGGIEVHQFYFFPYLQYVDEPNNPLIQQLANA